MNISKKVLAAGTIVASILALTACGNQNQSSTSKRKQVLNWPKGAQITTQDPSLATDTGSFQDLLNTGDGLYRFDKNNKPKLSLATKATVSKDGKSYDFVLRKNAKWSNGDPITAKDFVYSYRRTITPATKSQMALYLYQIKNAQAINQGKLKPTSLGVTAPSKYRLHIELTHPVTYFKNLLAWPLFFPQNEKVIKKYGKLYGTQAKYTVSSGPFILTKWNGNNKAWTLVKNKKYWDAKHVKLAKINEQVCETTSTSYNLYQANKLDMTGLTGPQIVANKNKATYHDRLLSAGVRLDLNQNRVKAFKNLKIRQAFSYAINRKAFVNQVLKNGSVAAKGFVPTNMGTNPKTGAQFANDAYVKEGVSYNLAKAKKLLREGYKETGIKGIKATLLLSSDAKVYAEYLQSQLDRLPNVDISIRYVPATQLFALQSTGKYDMIVKAWQAVFADPINFLSLYQKSSGHLNNGWSNAKYEKLLAEADNTSNPEKRWNELVAAEKVLMKDQGTIPLLQTASPQLLKSYVKDIHFNPTGVPYDFKYAYLN